MRGQNMNTNPARGEHTPKLGLDSHEMGNMLEHIRRIHDIDAGVCQRNSCAIIVEDGKNPMLGVVRSYHFNRRDTEAAPLQFECLLAGPGAKLQDMRADRKVWDHPIDLSTSNSVEVLVGEHGQGTRFTWLNDGDIRPTPIRKLLSSKG